MFEALAHDDRMLLLEFLCAFAWADHGVADKERGFVLRLLGKMGLPAEDHERVTAWLDVAPTTTALDPNRIPTEHRRTFLDAARAMIYADGKVDADERASFERLKKALQTPH